MRIKKKYSKAVDSADTVLYNEWTQQATIDQVIKACFGYTFGEFKMDTEVKQTRIRCSDEAFMEAVYSSKTYAEIASKTGQKVASTMARYGRVKKALAQKGITLPEVERKKPVKTVDNVDNLMEIVQRLKAAHSNG